MKEITDGIGKTGIRPGIIKLASSKDAITDYEKMFFRAAAQAHQGTGITLLTLLSEGFEDQIMLSHDSISVWLGRPPVVPPQAEAGVAKRHPTYLFEEVVPQLKQAGLTESQLDKLFMENPKRLFAGKAITV